MAWVEIVNEVLNGESGDWRLCFHQCIYHYDNGEQETGFRFIWRRPNGNLQAARGQARIPNAEDLFSLTQMAAAEGWFIRTE